MSSPREAADDRLIPVGVWIRLHLPEHPEYVCYTYVDQEMGLSAQNFQQHDPNDPDPKIIIVRLPVGVQWEVLVEEEVQRRGDVAEVAASFESKGLVRHAGFLLRLSLGVTGLRVVVEVGLVRLRCEPL